MRQTYISLYLITGFLGAGKTTLLKNLLNILPEKRKGVLINEFGRIGIDGELIRRDGLDILEINNGSIFCSCLHSSFVDGLIFFSGQPIDILFIEASGLSDPSSLDRTLEELAEKTGGVYRYEGSICVVDPTRFLELLGMAAFTERQIVYSHGIVINKADLVPELKLKAVEKEIRRLNPYAPIIRTSFGQVDEELLKVSLRSFETPPSQDSTNRSDNRPQTFVMKTEGSFDGGAFRDFLQTFAADTFRIKGFVKLEGNWHYIDGVGEDIAILPIKTHRQLSELVVIPKGSESIILKVKRTWNRCFPQRLTIE